MTKTISKRKLASLPTKGRWLVLTIRGLCPEHELRRITPILIGAGYNVLFLDSEDELPKAKENWVGRHLTTTVFVICKE